MGRPPGSPNKGPRKPATKKKGAGAADAAASRPASYGNGINPQVAAEYVDDIEEAHDEIASIMGKALNDCKKVHAEIKDIYEEASKNGLPRRALKAKIKERQYAKKAKAVRERLDSEDKDNFDMISHALGETGGPPGTDNAERGAAAVDSLAGEGTGEDAGDDPRPGFLKESHDEIAATENADKLAGMKTLN